MNPGRVPADVHQQFFLLYSHNHLSPLRQDSHLQLGAMARLNARGNPPGNAGADSLLS
jgi:hypothetical protein